uniref:Uncharacterized protein n=1 Tax=Romanomermis culicivorax TaxID=13658 RepID=A0A915IAZ7_ROMCU
MIIGARQTRIGCLSNDRSRTSSIDIFLRGLTRWWIIVIWAVQFLKDRSVSTRNVKTLFKSPTHHAIVYSLQMDLGKKEDAHKTLAALDS